MSSKYCLKYTFLQSVGKLFSLWIIHLGEGKQILAMCNLKLHGSQTFVISFIDN